MNVDAGARAVIASSFEAWLTESAIRLEGGELGCPDECHALVRRDDLPGGRGPACSRRRCKTRPAAQTCSVRDERLPRRAVWA